VVDVAVAFLKKKISCREVGVQLEIFCYICGS